MIIEYCPDLERSAQELGISFSAVKAQAENMVASKSDERFFTFETEAGTLTIALIYVESKSSENYVLVI